MYKLLLTFFLISSLLRADALFDKVFEQQFSTLQYTKEQKPKFLILFSGARGTGKTTIAKRLEEKFHAIRFSRDDAEVLFAKCGATSPDLNAYLLWGVDQIYRKSPNHLIILDASCDASYASLVKFARDEGFTPFLIHMEVDKETARGRSGCAHDFDRSWVDSQLFSFYNFADFHFPNNTVGESTLAHLISVLTDKMTPPPPPAQEAEIISTHLFAHVEPDSKAYKRIRKEILAYNSLGTQAVEKGLSEILPGLYIGSQWAADNPPEWVSHILTITTTGRRPGGRKCIWKSITLSDSARSNILQYFEESFQFIESTTSSIIVHCQVGGSRSPTLVIAYLMKKYHVPFEAALGFVRKKNPRANPNPGFITQLKAYESFLHIQSKERMMPAPVIAR